MRVFAAALLVCVVTFLAGVAGDLSLGGSAPVAGVQYASSGPSARVAIPPMLPRTASAMAAEAPRARRSSAVRLVAIAEPHVFQAELIQPASAVTLKAAPKPVFVAAAKLPEPAKAAA